MFRIGISSCSFDDPTFIYPIGGSHWQPGHLQSGHSHLEHSQPELRLLLLFHSSSIAQVPEYPYCPVGNKITMRTPLTFAPIFWKSISQSSLHPLHRHTVPVSFPVFSSMTIFHRKPQRYAKSCTSAGIKRSPLGCRSNQRGRGMDAPSNTSPWERLSLPFYIRRQQFLGRSYFQCSAEPASSYRVHPDHKSVPCSRNRHGFELRHRYLLRLGFYPVN